MPFDAVVFDLDGTLLDTEALILAAATPAGAKHGITFSKTLYASLVGTAPEHTFDAIAEHYPQTDVAQFMRDWDAEIAILKAEGIDMRPTALKLVEHLEARALPMAIATNAARNMTQAKLAKTPLDSKISIRFTLDDVVNAKPAPDLYLSAAEALNVDPQRCLAFEDSETGARAAMAAGMTVIQVPDIAPLSCENAHHIAPTLWDGARMVGLV